MGKKNSNLHRAKSNKNDEFYTCLKDIENELYRYKEHFDDKIVLCPCDESEHTNFFKFFNLNFEDYGIKKLICVGYRTNRPAEVHTLEKIDGGIAERNDLLIGDGDFRNVETQKLFDECDVVVTNPPFSLLREFVELLMNKGKKFIIIGNQNAITYKEIFPLIKDNKMWLGYNYPKEFKDKLNNYKLKKFGNVCWYTNLPIKKQEQWLDTGIDYNFGKKKGWYQKYDNYDAINVNKVNQIPMDYNGIMGVPITFLDKYNPNQFEILGATQRGCHDNVPDTKKYDEYLEMKPDGTPTGSKGGKTNENANLEMNDGKKNYFIHPQTGHIVQCTYQRIFIKRITN